MKFSPRDVAVALGGEASGSEIRAPGPNHSPIDRSLSIKINPTAPDGFVVHSFAGDDPLDCKDYVRTKLGIVWKPAPKADNNIVVRMSEKAAVRKAGTDQYVYQLADGSPYLRVSRPSFYQSHWTGSAWAKGAPDGPKILYRLPELLAAEHDTVLIAEGEKDADALAALGFTVTTNSGGAGNWSADLNEHLRGRDVFILPDNDKAGELHAKKVADSLALVAREIRIVRLPRLPPKGDVSDWIAEGGTATQLHQLMQQAPKEDEGPALAKLIVSSADFIAGFIPPDYLIDGLLQRRFCYSMTAPTGSGKTAVALLLSAMIALGKAVGDYQVEQGRVLYLAGENPDDVRMRWLAMADAMGFDVDTIDVHFLPGVFKLSEINARIHAEVSEIGPVAFVVVDTSAAYFEGDAENDNVQMGLHARRMRTLVTLPGEPCVLLACHPVKNAGPDNLIPRGGGAFIAEVDGNLTCSKSDSVVTLYWQGKYRGPDFAPLPFTLVTATTDDLKDSKGRLIPTVLAKPLSDRERSEAEANGRSDEDALLVVIADTDRASMAALATALNWRTKDNKPYKARVQRSADRLKKGGYVKLERGSLALSEKGKAEAIRTKQNAALAGARYG